MSLRLVSSAKNLREQFRGNSQQSSSNLLPAASSGNSILTSNSNKSNVKTMDSQGMSSGQSAISRQGSMLRTFSNGTMRRSKSMQKKTLIAKVFADDSEHHDNLSELSMEMTLVVVKRCIKEIRERGKSSPLDEFIRFSLTTKGILRQVQMGHNQKVVMDTIRMILDDDANTELSALRQVDIHLVAHAMKWAIRSSEETLVTYADYQTLYLDQDRSFSRFVYDLPPTNRAILLDLFSLCADVTLLAHLNNMTLVAVAKAISLSIMAEPEREFTTFDASLQQRNMWGAACEDLLRAFLRIKTTHDLAKIEQEDEVDENRYVDNITRVVKSARQRSNDNGGMPNIPMYARPDVSLPSSAASSIPPSSGWPSAATPLGRSGSGYFDHASTPRSASPLSGQSSQYTLSRNTSLAKSNSTRSPPISPARYYDQENEEIMQDKSHLDQLRFSPSFNPGNKDRRRSSVADMESLYMLPVDASTDGYESEPEPSLGGELPDFADDLGWDFTKMDSLHSEEPSTASINLQGAGVNRSNSSSSNGSTSAKGGHLQQPPQRSVYSTAKHPLGSASPHDAIYRNNGEISPRSPPQVGPQRSMSSSGRARVGIAFAEGHTSPAVSPQHAKRNSILRRSMSLDPHTMHGRVHRKPTELRHDMMARDLALQAKRADVADDIRDRLLQVKHSGSECVSSPTNSTFSLESSPQDLERPAIPTRNASQGLGRSISRSVSKSSDADTKLEINIGSLPSKQSPNGTMDELTPVSNASPSASITSPKPHQPQAAGSDKKFEVVSRPKDVEVSVHFTPITPVSPKAELKSKFQESFSDQPISPPQGYAQGQTKKSPTGQSSKMSPSSSNIPSPLQSQTVSRSNSRGQSSHPPLAMPPLQQSVSSSGVSSSSSQNSKEESKSKAAGFIRALSYKLRSKPSSEQLKPIKINNQVLETPALPPSVPIQPPRLELSFLGELGGSGHQAVDSNLPPASAPATLLRANSTSSSSSGSVTLESWKRSAQGSLPVPAAGSDRPGSPRSDQTKAFSGARRPSGTLFGSGNAAYREQRRKSKTVTAISPRSAQAGFPYAAAGTKTTDGKRTAGSSGFISGASHTSAVGRSPHRLANGRTLSDSSYTTDDSTSWEDTQGTNSTSQASKSAAMASATSPKKAGGEREYRFSTAMLLKDGKLYYQLQWDQFSESGFKSDFFHKPEQYLTDLQQKRISKMAPGGPGMSPTAGTGAAAGQMAKAGSVLPPTNSTTASQGYPSGTSLGQGQDMDPGPSPAQRQAAMKAARQSLIALAKDPKALAALKAGSTGGNGQATIIGTGSFPIGSTQPVLQSRPLNLWNVVNNIQNSPEAPSSISTLASTSSTAPKTTAVTTLPSASPATPSPKLLPYPRPSDWDHNKSSSSNNNNNRNQFLPAKDDAVRLQRNLSVKSSSTSSTVGTVSSDFRKEIGKPGKPSITAGGVGLSSSSPLARNLTADKFLKAPMSPALSATSAPGPPSTIVEPPMKSPKKNRLFGSKSKTAAVITPKKMNRLSTSAQAGMAGKRRLPPGVVRRDILTKTEESLDEVFPWTCIEHMAGQESGWVMLEPVQDGAVGWVKIDQLEEEMIRLTEAEHEQKQLPQQPPHAMMEREP
ncbi:hypothetical protein EDD11_006515 [Mortierella claussenii]|nr:hypothetical protein EDD11_006515 [Mortierella claussenii]